MIKNIKWLLIASLSIVACTKDPEPEVIVPEVPITAGSANFSKYVALGNSLSAGFSDGALFKEGQKGSYTKLMSDQFALAGGGAFKIPYMNDNRGGFAGVPNTVIAQRLISFGVVNNTPQIARLNDIILNPGNIYGNSSTSPLPGSAYVTGGINNMGVPGAKSFHLIIPGYGAFNPYFGRMQSSSSASVLGDAMAQAPTFFSLWIGNNDVLGNALAGGVPTSIDATNGADITPLAGPPGVGFEQSYKAIVNTLTANGTNNTKGVISNIPYVTSIPNFTTVPYNPLTSSVLGAGVPANGIAAIRQLNGGIYSHLAKALTTLGQASRFKLLSETISNPLLIRDRSLTNLSTQITTELLASPEFITVYGVTATATAGAFGAVYGQARQATKDDLVLLTTRVLIATVQTGVPAGISRIGISFPLADKDILTKTEIIDLNNAVDGYNIVIKGLADLRGLAFVNSNQILQNVARGVTFGNGYQISSSFVVGGAFSYDGVHPSPRGYALIANEFLKSINATYGSTFRSYDLSQFPIQIAKDLP